VWSPLSATRAGRSETPASGAQANLSGRGVVEILSPSTALVHLWAGHRGGGPDFGWASSGGAERLDHRAGCPGENAFPLAGHWAWPPSWGSRPEDHFRQQGNRQAAAGPPTSWDWAKVSTSSRSSAFFPGPFLLVYIVDLDQPPAWFRKTTPAGPVNVTRRAGNRAFARGGCPGSRGSAGWGRGCPRSSGHGGRAGPRCHVLVRRARPVSLTFGRRC